MPETLPVSETEVARDTRRARRLPSDRDQRQTLGICAGGRRRTRLAVRFVFSSQQISLSLQARALFSGWPFAAIAIGVAVAGFLNSRFVGRLGMRVISHGALSALVVVAGLMLVAAKGADAAAAAVHGTGGADDVRVRTMFANFTALAMEPQGHIAGTASSLYGSESLTLLASGSAPRSARTTTARCCRRRRIFLCTLACLAVVLVVEKGGCSGRTGWAV